MKPILIPLLLLSVSSSFSQELMKPRCVVLENASLVLLTNDYPSSMTAVSEDRQLIVGYNHFFDKNEVLLRLWDTDTGKLLRMKRIGNYKQHSSARLQFSPENRFVYVQGWTDIAYRSSNVNMLGVPFWDLASNQAVMSPCHTMEGVLTVTFSHDQQVAYVQSVGEDDHSLCGTQESKLFAHVQGQYFDPQTKQLFETFATKDYQYFHQLNEKLKQSAANKNVTLYRPSAPEEWLKRPTSALITHPIIPPPLPSKASDKAIETSEFLIPGGYASDDQYSTSNDFYKFDQYLFFAGRDQLVSDHFFLFNWQTGKGDVVKLPGGFSSERLHWVPKKQRLILKLSTGLITYDIKTKQIYPVHNADEIFEYTSVTNAEGEPELQYVAYDKRAKKNYYCRL